jgi:hypothetical protein
VCSLVIAAGLVLVGLGFTRGITGRAAEKLPALIQNVEPVPNANTVPNQSRIFVDLQAGYTGVLVVDGLELRTVTQEDLQSSVPFGQQIGTPLTTVYEEGNATLTFQPVKGAPVESLDAGTHVVEVIYWRLIDGRGPSARSFQWSFNVD